MLPTRAKWIHYLAWSLPRTCHKKLTSKVRPNTLIKHDLGNAQVSLGTSIAGDGEPTGGPSLSKRLSVQNQGHPPSNEVFFFVEATSSMKGKRSHVMKHHIREKRRQLAKSLGVDMSGRERPARYLPWMKKEEQETSGTDSGESDRLNCEVSALVWYLCWHLIPRHSVLHILNSNLFRLFLVSYCIF